MSHNTIREILVFLLLAGSSWAMLKIPNIEELTDGSVLYSVVHDKFIKRVVIAPNSKVTVNITNVSSDVSFYIAQIHTYQYNVTLSYTKDYLNDVSNNSVFGSNIGLFVRPGSNITTQLYLKNDNVHNVNAIFVAIPYNMNAPIPGGCNMEFNTEIAPYPNVTLQNTIVVVDVQPPSTPVNKNQRPDCHHNPVEVEFYRMFLTERDFSIDSYFIAIVNMLTVADIEQNGWKVVDSAVLTPMRRLFGAYIGTGSVYVAVARYGKDSAAYVPGLSYACSPLLDPDSCDILYEIFPRFVCAGCFFLGLFSFNTHYDSVYNKLIPTFFTGTVFGYMVAESFIDEANISAIISFALLMGLCDIIFWSFFITTQSSMNAVMRSINLGFFVMCVIYMCVPDKSGIGANNWFFAAMSLLLFLILTFVGLASGSVTPVITQTIFSTYMIILPLDYLIGSSLKYSVINVIRRVTVADYEMAAVQPPVQGKDITLIVLWVCLALYRTLRNFRFYMGPFDHSNEFTPLE
ncbi:transmembrane 7 superfamily member 3-like [Colletes gigas]|uniref:transmembrane 7 superfamily member 3-like n=1 Tax=Colletes gigas TaxID=935657 RepID=UPI001C9A7326|nr:transmembrane 7 superfamily member 3-like [Colletes gigas]